MTNNRVLANNIYGIKTIWQISKSRVIHIALNELVGYASWIFYSIFFMRYLINAIETGKPFATIMGFVALLFVLFLTLTLYRCYYDTVVISFTNNKIHRVLYKKLYAKARNVELSCFEDAEFYNRYTMALDDAAEKMISLTRTFMSTWIGAAGVAVTFSAIFSIDPYSILFMLAPIIGNVVFSRKQNEFDAKRYEESAKNNRKKDYVNRVMYLAEFAKEIRFSNIADLMMARFYHAVRDNQKIVGKYAGKITVTMWLKNALVFTVPFQGVMLYATYRAMISRTIGLAELVIMFTAMVTASWILRNLFENISESLRNARFIEYFRTFMEYEEKIPEDWDGITPDKKVKRIEFRNVSFAYKEGKPIIKNLSFVIEGDKIVALVGHNGAGKTTIIKLLFRLYDPTEGIILVNETDIRDYNLKAYRKLFAAAFQDYKIMSLSIKENILMGVRHDGNTGEKDDEIVRKALKQAGILEKVEALPAGIRTTMTKEFDESGAAFSGGEIQKIIAARAFASPASVKVFDEPSSALDPLAEYELYNSIMKQSFGQITLFISHRLSSVKAADIVFMLEEGIIIESGTHEELIKNNGAYCGMFTKQAQNYLADELYTEVLS
ncbi:MAG: ABC transporter ATP-binding protein/permease [Lachnospiraceae bacterium]|nr:ABC transporter ATP-binding protein/permease [Lachnospiraceae bacterium]